MFDAVKDFVGGAAYEVKDAYRQHQESKKKEGGGEHHGLLRERNRSQVDAALRTENPIAEKDAPEGLERTVEMDAARVQAELGRLPDKLFRQFKSAALANPKVAATIQPATRRAYYGSACHKEYGAYVAFLTGGKISAEEAMRMNPSGGIAGPGLKGHAFDSGPLHEHAIRHDATGFLMSAFEIGPGYGGRDGHNMLNGQMEGLLRETLVGKSQLPSTEHVGAPSTETRTRQSG